MRLCAQLLSPENWPGVASPRFRAWCHSGCELVWVAAPCVQKTQFPCGHQLPQELRLFRSQGGDTYDQNILFKTFKEASPCHSCCCSCRLLLRGNGCASSICWSGQVRQGFLHQRLWLWHYKTWFENESENGLEFPFSGSSNTETTKVNSRLETKFRWSKVRMARRLRRSGTETMPWALRCKTIPMWLKLTLYSPFSPKTGRGGAKLKTSTIGSVSTWAVWGGL